MLSELEKLLQEWKEAGFSGLYYDGECACSFDDLAPCGESFADCEPGYRHDDPRPGAPLGWIVSASKEKPSLEVFERLSREYL